MTLRLLALLLLLQDPRPADKGPDMDYGPFFTSTLARTKSEKDADILAFKAITIKVGKDAAVSYDTDLCRFAGAWSGGFLDLSFTHMTTSKGLFPSRPGGPLRFATKPGPGWAKGDDFKDPRATGRGPLPKDWAQYKGLYRDGDQVVLSYTVGSTTVLEMPGYMEAGSATAFTRTFNLGPADAAMKLLLFDDDSPGHVEIGLAGAPGVAKLENPGKATIVLSIPAHAAPVRFMVIYWLGAKGDLLHIKQIPDLSAHCKGGPARWTASTVTKGTLGKEEGAFAVDTLTLPDDNPYKAWLRLSGVDFFKDGRAAICTWSGDVWTCSGIDASLEKLTWKRYATGLYEPLGLKIVDDQVYVLGRDQITRLRDLDGDGEADFYENFNNDCGVTPAYHEFAHDLQTDSQGNFYYLKGSNLGGAVVAYHGSLIKVAKDGKSSEVWTTGFRAPNGMSVGPGDILTTSDNQGNWTPSTPINYITKQGQFCGFLPCSHQTPAPKERPNPLCWIPYNEDNSGGGQLWATTDKWGPLNGELFHLSYGKCVLFHVLREQVGDVIQGGVVKFPFKFISGSMRGRFNPGDGQMYFVGMRGWQTDGQRDGCFQRIRYTGGAMNMPLKAAVTATSIAITFTDKLDPETAGAADSYTATWANIKWTSDYGSPEFWVSDPAKKGREPLEVKGAKLSEDGKTVTLTFEALKPVHELVIKYKIRGADGAAINQEFDYTINKLP